MVSNDSLSTTTLAPKTSGPSRGNARSHSKVQIRKIAAGIREFGFTNPILTDLGKIVTGSWRVNAATILGLAKVPTRAQRKDRPRKKAIRAKPIARGR